MKLSTIGISQTNASLLPLVLRVISVCSCSPRLVTLCHCLLLTYMGRSGSETEGFVFATVLFLVGDFPGPTLTAGMLVVLCTHDS